MIYFVQQGAYLKIGYSADVKNRFRALQTASPIKLILLGVVNGNEAREREYHKLFASFSIDREWFSLCAGSLRLVADILSQPPNAPTKRVESRKYTRYDVIRAEIRLLCADLRWNAREFWADESFVWRDTYHATLASVRAAAFAGEVRDAQIIAYTLIAWVVLFVKIDKETSALRSAKLDLIYERAETRIRSGDLEHS